MYCGQSVALSMTGRVCIFSMVPFPSTEVELYLMSHGPPRSTCTSSQGTMLVLLGKGIFYSSEFAFLTHFTGLD